MEGVSCGYCERHPEHKEYLGCEGKPAKGVVDVGGKSYDTCPLYPLLRNREVIDVLTAYNYFKKSYPTYTEIQNINHFDMEMFDFIDGIIEDFKVKEQKKAMRGIDKKWQ